MEEEEEDLWSYVLASSRRRHVKRDLLQCQKSLVICLSVFWSKPYHHTSPALPLDFYFFSILVFFFFGESCLSPSSLASGSSSGFSALSLGRLSARAVPVRSWQVLMLLTSRTLGAASEPHSAAPQL